MPKLLTIAPLLSSAASLHMQNAEECACLPWKSVYANGELLCGQGYELGVYGKPKSSREFILANLKEEHYVAGCPETYMKLSFSKCLNKESGPTPEQWCYVRQECQEAAPVEGTNFAIKTCTEQDPSMRTVEPEELNKIGAADGVWNQHLAFISWNLQPDIWYEIMASTGISEDKLEGTTKMAKNEGLHWTVSPYSKTKAAKVQKDRDLGIVTIYSTEQWGAGGFPIIISGKKTYGFQAIEELGADGYVCIDGCDA